MSYFILEEMAEVGRRVAYRSNVTLADASFGPSRVDLLTSFLRDACRAAVRDAAPWLGELDERERLLVSETVSRILELSIAADLALPRDPVNVAAESLRLEGVDVAGEQFEAGRVLWRDQYANDRDLAGLTQVAREMLCRAC